MGAPAGELSATTPTRATDGLLPAALGWLGARVAVAAGLITAHLLSGSVHMPDGRLHLEQGLLTWDGTYYRVIAQGWYSGAATPPDAVRFFPLYPGLARILAPVTPAGAGTALLVVANLASLVAAWVLWHLAREVTGDRGVADRSAWTVALVPAAGVFAFGYSEPLMLLVTAAFLLALHRRVPVGAAALGLAAGMLRPAGVLLAVPAAVAAWQWWREERGQQRRSAADVTAWAVAVAAPVVGLVAAMAWISGAGRGFWEPLRLQSHNRDGFHEPFSRLVIAVVDIAGGHLHDVYNLAFAVGFAALFVVAVRRRQPAGWLALMAVTWVVAVGGTNMDSVGRYAVVAAPFAVALAQWARHRWQQVAVAAVGGTAMAWYTAEILLGRVIP